MRKLLQFVRIRSRLNGICSKIIRLAVLLYVRFPLSLCNVEDLLFERGIDACHETVRLWRERFRPKFAADIRRQQLSRRRKWFYGLILSQ